MKPLLLAALVAALGATSAAARTWTDSTGQHKVEADLVGVAGGQVRLRRADGKIVSIPLERLSSADQAFLRGQEPRPTGAAPAAPGAADSPLPVITNSIGMKLALIPAGDFLMGSEAADVEKPQHRVTITRPFYLSLTEVTQGEYERVMGENPSSFKGDPRQPVENVSWDDAVAFSRKLSQQEEQQYRLPTEAEWEYACRAGTTTPFSFGGMLNGEQANCDGNYPYGTSTKGPYKEETAAVGSYRANAWGLYDMHGNVGEWCADWYDAGYYGNSPTSDPPGPTHGSFRVSRGGNWRTFAGACRAASRGGDLPGYCFGYLGFRVVRVADDAALRPAAAPKAAAPSPDRPPESAGGGRIVAATNPQAKDSPLPVITNSIGMKLALIPAGSFLMGSPETEDDRCGDETQHRVTISRPFYLGLTEVTQREYEAVLGENPSNLKGDPRRPVETVSWDDAVAFCRNLSQQEGKQYRLPTEAEWEYACRAGSTTKWCFGDDQSLLGDYAWWGDNSGHPVGEKNANRWGLYDLHGNVWEWCGDWYDDYGSGAQTDPRGPSSGEFRVLRGLSGGSYDSTPTYHRSAIRGHLAPGEAYSSLGFRVARVADDAPLTTAAAGAGRVVTSATPRTNLAELRKRAAVFTQAGTFEESGAILIGRAAGIPDASVRAWQEALARAAPGGTDANLAADAWSPDEGDLRVKLAAGAAFLFQGKDYRAAVHARSLRRLQSFPKAALRALATIFSDGNLAVSDEYDTWFIAVALSGMDELYDKSDHCVPEQGRRFVNRLHSVTQEAMQRCAADIDEDREIPEVDAALAIVLVDGFFRDDRFDVQAFNAALPE